jgi:hypothetical protein
VIERLEIPLNEWEVLAIVFGVAASAFLAGAWGNVVTRMQSLMHLEARGDFIVAVQALECRLSAKFVAG